MAVASPAPTRALLDPYRFGDASTEARLWALEVWRRKLRLKLITGDPDPEVRQERIESERELCRRDVVHELEQWGWTNDPREPIPERRAKPFIPWPAQAEMLRWLRRQLDAGEVALSEKGRALGVTWCHVVDDAHLLRYTTGHRSKWGSRKEELVDGDADSPFAMLRFYLEHLPPFLRAETYDKKLTLRFPETGGEITGESTNAGFARGGRRTTITLDEYAHVEPVLAQQIWTSVQTVARSLRIVSSHKGPGTVFARLASTLPPHCVKTLDWPTDPRRPEDFRAQCIAQGMTPEEFDQEHGAKAVTLATGKMLKGPLDTEALKTWQPNPLKVGDDRPRLPIEAIGYNDGSDDWRRVVADIDIRKRGGLICGWDFGSGPSLLVCLKALVEPGMGWRLWLDFEHVWSQRDWMSAAYEVRQHDAEVYGWQVRWHVGDPSGINRESDGESWCTNLQAGGIPLACLDAEYNTRDGQEWMIKQIQALIDAGRLRVHQRCRYLWDCLRNWTRAIPVGADPNLLNKLYIAPSHDFYSHGGWALAYLVTGAILAMSAAHDQEFRELPSSIPPGPGGSIGRMLSAGG